MDYNEDVSHTYKVRAILASLLDVPIEQIAADATMDDIEQWDSLIQMNLVIALEDEFGVVIPDTEVGSMVTIPLINSLLLELLS